MSAPVDITSSRAALDDPAPSSVRGAKVLAWLESAFLRADQVIGRVLPDRFNPLQHTGALADTSLIVATVTGVVLLVWYSSSVNFAYASVLEMDRHPFTSGFVRSLHRYSSDACLFFILVHSLRVFFERRFTGARWLAWVTGILSVSTVWFVGWLGYWLVWDERGRAVAVGTARLLDELPIFTDPMGRAFLTDEGVNSLLFFVVFFFHMLVPLVLGVLLWLHLARLNRPRWITRGPVTWWLLGAMAVVSLVYPAKVTVPAQMTAVVSHYTMDWWYLAPIVLTDRLSGGALWGLLLVGTPLLLAVPWMFGRKAPGAAVVKPSGCTNCSKCFVDCPYDAISMVPRTDGRNFALQAQVDPNRCVECGICAGSCDGAGVGLPWFDTLAQRAILDGWMSEDKAAGQSRHVAFSCGESAGARLVVDPHSGACDALPGYRVMQVPCAGWVHVLTIERVLRRGAAGVLVASCREGSCVNREGAQWAVERLTGQRLPALRADHAPPDKVLRLGLDRTATAELVQRARSFREGRAPSSTINRPPAAVFAAGLLVTALLTALIAVGSDLGYAAPALLAPELVVTFKHPGETSENCRELSEEELASRAPHMRTPVECDRMRAPVRLRIALDGVVVDEDAYPPAGIWGDGNSVAVRRIPVTPGIHTVSVAIGDTADTQWTYTDERTVEFETTVRRVVVFDRLEGFSWH